jgi:L-alanine-DL-glutamate epimerase-like enolase superfamily enzyme
MPPLLYVRMRSHGGAEGWGEAAANLIMASETLAGMVAAVRDVLAPRLLGKSVFDGARLARELRAATYANGGAIAALDMAMLDLVGVLRNVPAVDLLGGARRRSARAGRFGWSGAPASPGRRRVQPCRDASRRPLRRAVPGKAGVVELDAPPRSFAAHLRCFLEVPSRHAQIPGQVALLQQRQPGSSRRVLQTARPAAHAV